MVMRSGGGQTGTGYKQLYWRLPVLCDRVFSEEQQLPRTQHLKLRVFLIRLCLLQTFQEAQGTCCHSSSCWTWPPPPLPAVDLKFRTAFRATVTVRGPANTEYEGEWRNQFPRTWAHFHLLHVDARHLRRAVNMDLIKKKKKVLHFLLCPLWQKNSFPKQFEVVRDAEWLAKASKCVLCVGSN